MPTIDATVGGAFSNSYETHAEANEYFETRFPLAVPWVTSGQESLLIMATRVLNNMFQPRKTLFADCGCKFYRINRTWTGTPATATQRLPWPRAGVFDENGNPLDYYITNISVANPTVITTSAPHHLEAGTKVLVTGSDSTPNIDGEQTVTVLTATTFSIPINVTTGGTVGRIFIIPQALKDAQSELAGQLAMEDTTLNNPVIVQGLTSVRAGSVALGFKDTILPQVIPDAVLNMLPWSWLTDERVEPAYPALFDVISS